MAGHNKLTAKAVANAGPGFHSDGGGLYLSVKGNARSWVLRHMYNGRRRDMGLGSAYSVSLADARAKAAEARKQLQDGKDPMRRLRTGDAPPLKAIIDQYLHLNRDRWTDGKSRDKWIRRLELHAAGLMDQPVDAIDVDLVVKALTPVWQASRPTAAKVRGALERLLSFSIALRHRPGPNPAAWTDNLEHILPALQKDHQQHLAAVPVACAPELFARIWAQQGQHTGARALVFAILSAARSIEARRVQFAWVDEAARAIHYPASAMKARRPHTVPISDTVQRMIDEAPRQPGQIHVWGNARGMVGERSLLRVHESVGIDAAVHGWRATFSSWAAEAGHERELVESQLHHHVGNEVERSYRRGDYLERRRALMADWDAFITSAVNG